MQKDALDRARAAFKEANYSRALEQYEYFFDHALDDDPHSLYGVRLSYCLAEWVRLGELYPEQQFPDPLEKQQLRNFLKWPS